MTGDVWEYRPQSHKTEHHGKARTIFLGPQAQEVIREFLKPNVEAYLFSPAEAEAERKAELRQNRKTPVQPSQQNRSQGTRNYGDCYHRDSYRNAIHRACEKAFGMPDHLRKISGALPAEGREQLQAEAREWRRQHCWSPHRLRHNAATEIRKIADLDTARSVLGHSSLRVTEIYAERDSQAARSIMAKIG